MTTKTKKKSATQPKVDEIDTNIAEFESAMIEEFGCFPASKHRSRPKEVEKIDLDNTPLTFGKGYGKTPQQLFDAGEYKYLCWMYKTVTNRNTLTESLYRQAKNLSVKSKPVFSLRRIWSTS